MGIIINAVCEDCGYSNKHMYIGGGFRDFDSNFRMPGIHRLTGKFELRNYYRKNKIEHSFDFYAEPHMYRGKINKKERGRIEWDNTFLCTSQNLCPQCRQFTMQFIRAGFWD